MSIQLELDFTKTNVLIDIIKFKIEDESKYYELINDLDSHSLYDSSQVYSILRKYKAYDVIEIEHEKLYTNNIIVKRTLYDEREEK